VINNTTCYLHLVFTIIVSSLVCVYFVFVLRAPPCYLVNCTPECFYGFISLILSICFMNFANALLCFLMSMSLFMGQLSVLAPAAIRRSLSSFIIAHSYRYLIVSYRHSGSRTSSFCIVMSLPAGSQYSNRDQRCVFRLQHQ
jgi:hypothetical protein